MSVAAIFNGDFSVRFVEMLMHSLWQGVAIAFVVATVNKLGRHRSAAVRYGIGLAALISMAVCLPLTFMLISPSERTIATVQPEPIGLTQSANNRDNARVTITEEVQGFSSHQASKVLPTSNVVKPSANGTVSKQAAPSTDWRTHASPYVVRFYMLGVVLMFVRLVAALGGGERLRRHSIPATEPCILEVLGRKARELGLRAAPAVAKCERIAVPLVVGIVKPVILLPIAILSELTPSQVEAVLAHELAHIRRWDHVANLLQRIVEAVLFYHPAVWYVSRCVSRERENCCDDMVLATGTEAAGYAELLVRVAEIAQRQSAPSATALAATGRQPTRLRERVLRILGNAVDPPFRVTRTTAAIGVVLLSVVGLGFALGVELSSTERRLTEAEWEELVADFQTLHNIWQEIGDDQETVLMIDSENGRVQLVSSGIPIREDATILLHEAFKWRIEHLTNGGRQHLKTPAFFQQPKRINGKAFPDFPEIVILTGRNEDDSVQFGITASGLGSGRPAGELTSAAFPTREEGAKSIVIEEEEWSALAKIMKPVVLSRNELKRASSAIAVLEDKDANEQAVSTATESLVQLGPGVAELLVPLLAQGMTDVRAMHALAPLATSPHVQRVLCKAANNAAESGPGNTNTIHCVLAILGQSGNRAHVDFVAKHFDTHSIAAITALSEIGGPQAATSLAGAFDVIPKREWFLLANCLETVGDKTAVPALRKRLEMVDLPPSEQFPRATVPAFLKAIRSLTSEGDTTAPIRSVSYSFQQGTTFLFPFDGPGSPKTFSLGSQPQSHHVKVPQVDSTTPQGRTEIWQAMEAATDEPGFTIDDGTIVTFHNLAIAPLWPEGKPYPTTAFDWVDEMPHFVLRDSVNVWMARHLKDGPIPYSKMMTIPQNGLLLAMDPNDDRLTVLSLQRREGEFQYKVTIRPLDPLQQLVGANWRAFPKTMGFTRTRYCNLHDLESGTRDGALNMNDAQLTTMTEEQWRRPGSDAILVAEFARNQLALGVPGVEQFLLVEASDCWDDPQHAVGTLINALAANDDPNRMKSGGAIFYKLPNVKADAVFAFAAAMPDGIPVGGVLKIKEVDMQQETVRLDHKFLPTWMAKAAFAGELPDDNAQSENNAAEAVQQENASANLAPNDEGTARQLVQPSQRLHRAWSLKTPLEFTSEQEMSIVLPKDGWPEFLDLQRALTVTPPHSPESEKAINAKLKSWAVTNKTPFEFRASKQGVELRAHDVAMGVSARLVADQETIDRWPENVDASGRYKVDLLQFETTSPRELMQLLYDLQWAAIRFSPPDSSESMEQFRNQRWAFNADALPAIIRFWDSNDQLGYLHIQSYSPEKRLLKLRYKLVRIASADMPDEGSNDENKNDKPSKSIPGDVDAAKVQSSLVADRAVSIYAIGEIPTLRAYLRNADDDDWFVTPATQAAEPLTLTPKTDNDSQEIDNGKSVTGVSQMACRLEVDGRWYRRFGALPVATGSLKLTPGKSLEDMPVSLDSSWRDEKSQSPLELKVGKHNVRLEFSLQRGAQQIRTVSNAVEIEMIPVAWSDVVDGIRVGIALASAEAQTGKIPNCWWCIQNATDQPRAVWLGEEDLLSIGVAGDRRTTYTRGLRHIPGVSLAPMRVVLQGRETRISEVSLNVLRQGHGEFDKLLNPVAKPGLYEICAVYDPSDRTARFGPPSNKDDYPDVIFRRIESSVVEVTVLENDKAEDGSVSEKTGSATATTAKLPFLSNVPEFHELELGTSEEQLKQIIAKHNLIAHAIPSANRTSYMVFTLKGECVIVSITDGKCIGIQRMRADRDLGLNWGKPVDGLQAAASVVPNRTSFPAPSRIEVLFYLRNISENDIQLRTWQWRQPGEDVLIVEDEQGTRQKLGGAWSSGDPKLVVKTLHPGEVLASLRTAVGIAETSAELNQLKSPLPFSVEAKPGKYRARFQLKFPRLNSNPTQWTGTVETGTTSFTITDPDKGIEEIYLTALESLTREVAAWGKPVDGLRYRWLPLEKTIAAGEPIEVMSEVQNVSDETVYWEGRSEITWSMQRSTDKGTWTMPRFTALPLGKSRDATLAEVDDVFGITFLTAPKGRTGYFVLPPDSKILLKSTLPWKFDKPARYRINAQLARRNPITNRLLEESEWMISPPLEFEIVARAEPNREQSPDATGDTPQKRTSQNESKTSEFQGVWKLSNDEYVNADNSMWVEAARRSPAWEWAITADKITLDSDEQLTYQVDWGQDPPTIDITGLDRNKANTVTLGVLELDRETLVLCLSRAGEKQRPAGFSPMSPAARKYVFQRENDSERLNKAAQSKVSSTPSEHRNENRTSAQADETQDGPPALLVQSADESMEFPQATLACKVKLGMIVESEQDSLIGTKCEATCEVISPLKGMVGDNLRITFRRGGNGIRMPGVDRVKAGETYLVMLQGDREPYQLFAAMKAFDAVVTSNLGTRPGDRLLAELIAISKSDDTAMRIAAIQQIGIMRDKRGRQAGSEAADSTNTETARTGVIALYRMGIAPDAKRVMELFNEQVMEVWYGESGIPQKDSDGNSIRRRERGISILERGLPDFDYAAYVREGIKHDWVRRDDQSLYVFFGVPWKVQRRECVPELVKLLDYEDERVQWWAVKCLMHTVEGRHDSPRGEEYRMAAQEELDKWRRWWDENGKAYLAE